MTTDPRRGARLDRPVLVSNLVSGALWLVIAAGFGAWPLSVLGAVYVLPTSVLIAAAHARGSRSPVRRVVVWALPWLAATALWGLLISATEPVPSPSTYAVGFVAGAAVATTCLVAWQTVAFAFRHHFLAATARAATAGAPAEPSAQPR
ncbi:hypothetical protein [Nocardioides sp. YIM 152588]|uniref:hypothetical protein n=1 Tax=Nocardioides sp. YIM 152588 TaxID=3158259 RepID=UPI0032E3C7CE